MHVAHFTFDLRFRRQRCNRVDHHDVDCAGTHDHVADLERLLAGIGLRHEQIVSIHAERCSVERIERVLGIDECTGTALPLRFRDHLQGQGGLAGGFGPVDLDDTAARQTADAERDVEP